MVTNVNNQNDCALYGQTSSVGVEWYGVGGGACLVTSVVKECSCEKVCVGVGVWCVLVCDVVFVILCL